MIKKNTKQNKQILKQPMRLIDAINAVKEQSGLSKKNFTESIDLILVTNRVNKLSDNSLIRGTIRLPKGRGSDANVVVFTKDETQRLRSIEKGASDAGIENLIAKIDNFKINIDFCLAAPDAMAAISKVAKKLGPRGIIPNQKDETISNNLEESVEEFIKNRIRYKCTKSGIIQCLVGKVTFDVDSIKENLIWICKSIIANPIITSKSDFISGAYIKSTMGNSYKITIENLAI